MELQVQDMTCGQCSGVITQAVRDVDAQATVNIDLTNRTVRIESAHSVSDFLSAIRAASYTPTVRT
ncbi:heavy-metal-associated domain-containing protein [Burkholderia pseudomallei]|uniref:heavy-metal-associated domain-containing protein n=1 Tax=Burkholderia pseudomallei TaxID=28450 RepID=UPI000F091AB6|nr:heavy-metal-associated domain-containing protein [Burkholderia pseudomallei]VCJ27869.1 heavy metal transport/detoxification protein [Burkholderia pseudomallei]VCJ29051.1 heavy metal transport/detoxification protein [Burkholderia pseudomallei]